MGSMRNKRQKGFVSIIVASLLMVILALITIGFTRLMQREQRQAVDRQLSRQALYAAESGINDVIQAIVDKTPPYDQPSKTDCAVGNLGPFGDGRLSADGTIAYTCAIYDQAPGSLNYDIGSDKSKLVELRTSNGNNFASLNVSWGNPVAPNDLGPLPLCTGLPATFPPSYPADAPPVLKLDLTRVNPGGTNYDRDQLLQQTEYMYLAPCRGSGTGSHNFDTATRGDVVEVPCSGSGVAEPCVVNINGLAAAASDTFFARIRPVYNDAKISISALDGTGGGVQFKGAQVGVDVTARAGDVVRRLRVSVPFSSNDPEVPEVALQAFDGICKRLDVISDAVPGANIVDNCYGGGTPPAQQEVCRIPLGTGTEFIDKAIYDANPGAYTSPPCVVSPGSCPTLAGQTVNAFNLSSIAWVASGGNIVTAPLMIDVLYNGNPADPGFAGQQGLRYTTPDLDLATRTGTTTFRVEAGCKYQVDFELFCGAPQNAADFAAGNPPPLFICHPGQINESFRANFYSAYDAGNPNQCDRSTLLAYFDIPDYFVGAVSSSSHSDSSVVTVPGGNYGDIRCMELVAGCEVSTSHIGCNFSNVLGFSSIYMHKMTWIEEPI